MSKEKIDWSAHLQAPEASLGGEVITNLMDEFTQYAAVELEPLYISDEVVAKVEAAGCKIKGTRYFAKLYSDDETITVAERTKSTFTGSVAHGRGDLASKAYSLLAASAPNLNELHEDLLDRLSSAMKNERWSGGWSRHKNLEAAAKALGRPLHQRAMGILASGMAMRAAPNGH